MLRNFRRVRVRSSMMRVQRSVAILASTAFAVLTTLQPILIALAIFLLTARSTAVASFLRLKFFLCFQAQCLDFLNFNLIEVFKDKGVLFK